MYLISALLDTLDNLVNLDSSNFHQSALYVFKCTTQLSILALIRKILISTYVYNFRRVRSKMKKVKNPLPREISFFLENTPNGVPYFTLHKVKKTHKFSIFNKRLYLSFQVRLGQVRLGPVRLRPVKSRLLGLFDSFLTIVQSSNFLPRCTISFSVAMFQSCNH